MRYLCLKKTISTLFDGILNNHDEIINVLKTLKEKELVCSIHMKLLSLCDNARILEVNEETNFFMWRAFYKDGSTFKKQSAVDDILMITSMVDDDIAVKIRPYPSRGETLDIAL